MTLNPFTLLPSALADRKKGQEKASEASLKIFNPWRVKAHERKEEH
jgi:hypothetical protein